MAPLPNSTCDLPCLVAKKNLFGSCRHGFCAVCMLFGKAIGRKYAAGYNHCQGAGQNKPTHADFFLFNKCR